MIIYILSLFWLVRSIYLKENIGDLYLTESETYELKLSDYFSGNNLTYQISETDAKEDEIALKGGVNLKLLSFLPFKSQVGNDSFFLTKESYKSWNLDTSLIFCSFYQNYIYIYQIPYDESNITLIYAEKIQTQFLSPTIENVQNLKIGNDLAFLIYIKQQENIDKNLIWRNDFYLLKSTDSLVTEGPVLLELDSLTYASKIVINNGENVPKISIYAEFPNTNIPNTIYVYNFADPYHPINFWNITKSFAFTSPAQQLSVKGILHTSNQIYVLDGNIGMLSYAYLFFYKLRENYYVDLQFYGDLHSIWFLGGRYSTIEQINIQTSLGSILLNMGGEIKKWIPNREINEIKYETLFSQLYNDYFVASYVYKNESILSIIDQNSPSETRIEINIKNLIGSSHNPAGQWRIINYLNNNEIYYVRSDLDGLRQFSLNFESFKLKITGKSNFKALITAKEKDSSISCSVSIVSIPLGSKDILPISNYRPAIIDPITLIFDARSKYIDIPLNSYISGPNICYTIKYSNSALFSYNASVPSKFKLLERVTVSKDALWVEKKDISIIYYYKDYIEIADEKIWNITNPINIVCTGKNVWIYWKTQESIPMISSYILKDYSSMETWESETECSIFKHDFTFGIFMCSDLKRIDIYLAVDYSSQKVITLAGENFKEGFQWNLNEIFIYSISFQDFLIYLIDKNNGLLIIEYRTNEIPNTYMVHDKTFKDIHSILYSKNLIYMVRQNGTVNTFSYPLNYVKTLQFEKGGNVLNASLVKNYLYIQFDEMLHVYDTDMPAHNALFLEMKLEKNSYFSNIEISKANLYADFLEFMIYYPISEEKYYEIYKIFEYQDQLTQISISAKSPEKLIDQIYQEEISVIAYNGYSKLSIDLKLNLIPNGAFVWYDENSHLSIKKEINYDDQYNIDLSNLFHGQKIEMALNINGKFFNSQDGVMAPAYVSKRTEIIGHYNSSNTLYHYILIPGTDIQVITSDEALILIQIMKNTNEGFSLNLSKIFDAEELTCKLIDNFQFTKNSHALIVTTCAHKVSFLNSTGVFSIKHVLILWELDYVLFTIKSFKSLPLGRRPVNLKTLTLDNTNFEIILSESSSSLYFEKKLLRFRGSWILGDIKLQQIEIISSASLKLPSFRSYIYDGIVANSNTAYWYIMDLVYGLRVLKTNENYSDFIIEFPMERIDLFSSIGVCGDYLYVCTNSLKKYSIKNYSDITLIEEYYLNNLPTSSYSRIVCSEDGKYATLYLFDSITKYSVRIIDTSTNPYSSHVHNVEIENDLIFTDINEAKFINLNTFLVAQKHQLLAIKINPSMLYIPKLNESEYNKMIKEWGTNEFDIFITAKNEDSQANSSVISFKRTQIENKEKSNSFRLR